MKGVFITFEGIEGSGKSTQIARLRAFLESHNQPVIETREPGGTPISESIRALLLNPAHSAMVPITELLLYAAARAQHVAERITPALEAGYVVLSDRFSDSTLAYQQAGRSLPAEAIEGINNWATGGLCPELTIVIDVPVEMGLRRALNVGELDRIEQESREFHERVRQAFIDLAEHDSERIHVIDGTLPADEVEKAIRELVAPLLELP
ncbi:MAG: thymidylate kinase [Candidatus Hydrogenedentota bacterium]